MNRHDAEVAVRRALHDAEELHVSIIQRVDPYAVAGPDGIPRMTLSEAIDMFLRNYRAAPHLPREGSDATD